MKNEPAGVYTLEGLAANSSFLGTFKRLGQPETKDFVLDDGVTRVTYGRLVLRFRQDRLITIRGASLLELDGQECLTRGLPESDILDKLGPPDFLDDEDDKDEAIPIKIWSYKKGSVLLRIVTADSVIDEMGLETEEQVG